MEINKIIFEMAQYLILLKILSQLINNQVKLRTFDLFSPVIAFVMANLGSFWEMSFLKFSESCARWRRTDSLQKYR